ncbi:MAG: Putative glycosyltransferase [Burkholderiaceae bacterium]|nr:MAG: Putative glycosyltransferase [Burkholderiaceae bacterium]
MNSADPTRAAADPEVTCRVSIIIKALNEERNIAATIESALRAAATVASEVVLADSCSTDATVELATRYPVRIAQLAHAGERCCGVGPQLGYQHSNGEFIFVMDGDMLLRAGFLEQALAFLVAHPQAAGVGGFVVERNTASLEYAARIERKPAHLAAGQVDRLDGGGLYRRSAIEAAGYLSDRNLHAYEEFDLAARLRALNWQLWRLPVPAVDHFGHDEPPYRLLMRRWRSRYAWGLGELIRAAVGRPHLHLVLRGLRELYLYILVLIWWLVLVSVPLWPLSAPLRIGAFCTLVVIPMMLMVWRKRSADKALYSVASWCVNAAGLVCGVLRPRQPVRDPVPSRVLLDRVGSAPQSSRHANSSGDASRFVRSC